MSRLDRQLTRLIIEWRSENGTISVEDQKGMKEEILQLIEEELK